MKFQAQRKERQRRARTGSVQHHRIERQRYDKTPNEKTKKKSQIRERKRTLQIGLNLIDEQMNRIQSNLWYSRVLAFS